MSSNSKQAIIFDIDGTLSDSYELGFSSSNIVLSNNNYKPINSIEYHEGTKYSTPRRFAWHVTGDPDNKVIGEFLGNQFDELYVKLVNPENTALYPGIIALLGSIRDQYPGVKIAALSNACGAYVKNVLAVNSIDHFFFPQLGADDVPLPKPCPDGLIKCCEILQVDPRNCIYIGDSPSDAEAAHQANMLSVGVTWGSHSVEKVEAAFNHTTYSVAQLQELLVNLIGTTRNLENK
eukprot:gene7750-10528_t